MDNLEEVLHCLNEFDQTSDKSISPELEKLLEHIAKTGRTVFPWHLLKPLISFKLEKVLNDFFETSPGLNPYLSEPTTKGQDFQSIVEKLVNNLNCFSGTPFTIQRLCELITQPRKHYNTSDKFLRGVEKNIMVVSTVQPDGSLITRSTNTVLTNGNVSPTDTVPVDTGNTAVQSSPLNTNFQENGPSRLSPSAVIPAEEKMQTLLRPDTTVNLLQEVNGSPNEEAAEKEPVVPDDLKCQENGQSEKSVASDDMAVPVLDNTAGDSSTDNVETCKEKELQSLEQRSKVQNDEKPADQSAESHEGEKMDES